MSYTSPSFYGYIRDASDAENVFKAAAEGRCHVVTQRIDKGFEVIKAGQGYVYDETVGSIKRWTDGIAWSESYHPGGKVLVYRQMQVSKFGNRTVKTEVVNGMRKKTIADAQGRFRIVCYYYETPQYYGQGPRLVSKEEADENFRKFIRALQDPQAPFLAPRTLPDIMGKASDYTNARADGPLIGAVSEAPKRRHSTIESGKGSHAHMDSSIHSSPQQQGDESSGDEARGDDIDHHNQLAEDYSQCKGAGPTNRILASRSMDDQLCARAAGLGEDPTTTSYGGSKQGGSARGGNAASRSKSSSPRSSTHTHTAMASMSVDQWISARPDSLSGAHPSLQPPGADHLYTISEASVDHDSGDSPQGAGTTSGKTRSTGRQNSRPGPVLSRRSASSEGHGKVVPPGTTKSSPQSLVPPSSTSSFKSSSAPVSGSVGTTTTSSASRPSPYARTGMKELINASSKSTYHGASASAQPGGASVSSVHGQHRMKSPHRESGPVTSSPPRAEVDTVGARAVGHSRTLQGDHTMPRRTSPSESTSAVGTGYYRDGPHHTPWPYASENTAVPWGSAPVDASRSHYHDRQPPENLGISGEYTGSAAAVQHPHTHTGISIHTPAHAHAHRRPSLSYGVDSILVNTQHHVHGPEDFQQQPRSTDSSRPQLPHDIAQTPSFQCRECDQSARKGADALTQLSSSPMAVDRAEEQSIMGDYNNSHTAKPTVSSAPQTATLSGNSEPYGALYAATAVPSSGSEAHCLQSGYPKSLMRTVSLPLAVTHSAPLPGAAHSSAHRNSAVVGSESFSRHTGSTSGHGHSWYPRGAAAPPPPAGPLTGAQQDNAFYEHYSFRFTAAELAHHARNAPSYYRCYGHHHEETAPSSSEYGRGDHAEGHFLPARDHHAYGGRGWPAHGKRSVHPENFGHHPAPEQPAYADAYNAHNRLEPDTTNHSAYPHSYHHNHADSHQIRHASNYQNLHAYYTHNNRRLSSTSGAAAPAHHSHGVVYSSGAPRDHLHHYGHRDPPPGAAYGPSAPYRRAQSDAPMYINPAAGIRGPADSEQGPFPPNREHHSGSGTAATTTWHTANAENPALTPIRPKTHQPT